MRCRLNMLRCSNNTQTHNNIVGSLFPVVSKLIISEFVQDEKKKKFVEVDSAFLWM